MVDRSFCQIHCFTLFLKPIKMWQQCLKLVIKFAHVFSNLTKLVILQFNRWATLYYILKNVTVLYDYSKMSLYDWFGLEIFINPFIRIKYY